MELFQSEANVTSGKLRSSQPNLQIYRTMGYSQHFHYNFLIKVILNFFSVTNKMLRTVQLNERQNNCYFDNDLEVETHFRMSSEQIRHRS